MSQDGIHWIKTRVAVGAVDNGMELSLQIHLVAEVGQAEIGRIRLAVDVQIAQCSDIVAGRAERACNPVEVAKVGIVETIIAGDRRLAGIGHLPRTEDALGVNRAHRPRIGEFGFEVHGVVGRDATQLEARNVNLERQLARFAGAEDQDRIFAVNIAELHAYWKPAGTRLRDVAGWRRRDVQEVRFRRQVNVQALEMNLANVNRLIRLVAQGDVEAEGGQADQRLDGRPIGRRRVGNLDAGHLGRRPNAQAVSLGPYAPLASQAVAERDVEGVEFDAGMEVACQTLHNARMQIRLCPARRHDPGNRNRYQQDKEDAHGAQEPRMPACERSLLLSGSHFQPGSISTLLDAFAASAAPPFSD